mmetsp:Transcript_18515/g.45451  ORF Transcript_18515/g.45451 Transcript_18515/m.45451 type:complete len:239 (+) Transcript_18515:147-863(+)
MGQCLGGASKGPNAQEHLSNMSQDKIDDQLAKAIATKAQRIPELNRERVWTPEEVAALSKVGQPWAWLEDDTMGLRYEYPTLWESLPPLKNGTRLDRVVRTGHLVKENHMRPSGEMCVGFARFNAKAPKDPVLLETFMTFTEKLTNGASRISGGKILLKETLPAGSFKSSTHPVVHNLSTFLQSDGTTSRVEQWMLLSRDRAMFVAITIFNSDLPCYDTYRPIQDRWLASVKFADGTM